MTTTHSTIIEMDQAQLFCQTMGAGKPIIVLHGGPGMSQDYLLPYLYSLADNHFVIFYDQRGCGQSTGNIDLQTMTIDTFVNDIEKIRQAFHLDTISILGHSWGGFLAMEYAIAHPEAVDKLILANTMPASSNGLALFRNEWQKRMQPYQEEIDLIRNNPEFIQGDPQLTEHLHRIMFRTYCYDSGKADLLNLRMSATAAVNGARIYQLIKQNVFEKNFDLHPQLNQLPISTLIIHGDFDPIPPSTAFAIHSCLKNSQYILMKNCGHFPYVEDQEIFFNIIEKFLNELN